MQKRITTIVGAGAVLDFDYAYEDAILPSTKNITDAIKVLKVPGLDTRESDVITHVYDTVCKNMSHIYYNRGIYKKYEPYFEELYFLIESLLSYAQTGIDYYDPHACSPLTSLLFVREELLKYPHVEYERALSKILKEIISIIERYDNHFRECADSDNWYRTFWKGKDNIKYDIFTFNYDTTIEQCIGDYEDGFELIENSEDKISAFHPKKLLSNLKKLSTVQHLHGCIYYAENPEECGNNYSNRDFFKTNNVKDALKCIGRQQDEQSQAKEFYINSPILIGLRKLDKMTFMPSSIYHANLVNKLMTNRGVLIIGYSFGDLYVNQLLQRRLQIKGTNHRMVIIDFIQTRVNSLENLYNIMQNEKGRLMQFIKPFMNLRRDDNFNIRGAEFRSYNDPIYSEDHKCMLFICGIRKAVETHADLIWNFL